ncbi:12412_t:CDS:2, partial [Racocetra persica]
DNSLDTNEPIPLSDNSANRRNLPSGPQFKLDLQFFAVSKTKKTTKIAPQFRQKRLKKFEEDLKLAAQYAQRLIEENQNLRIENEELNREVKNLKERNEADGNHLIEREEEVEKLNRQVRELSESISKLNIRNGSIPTLERELEEKEEAIARLEETITTLQGENEAYERAVKQATEGFHAKNREIAARESDIKSLEDELEKRDNEIKRLKKINERQAKEITELKEEKEDLTQKWETSEVKLADQTKGRLSIIEESNNNLKAENEALKRDLFSRLARPSLSSQTSSMRSNYVPESRPVSRATSYIEGLDIEIDESSPYYCKHCGQLKNNLGSILNDPRNYELPTTPDESRSEKEEKSHHNSAPRVRGPSDESSYYAESPTNSMLIEDTASTSHLDDLLKETASIYQLEKELKKQLTRAKFAGNTDSVNEINSLSKSFENVSLEYENLKLAEDNSSPNEETSENKLSEAAPIVIVSDENTPTTPENIPLIPRAKEMEEIAAQAAELTDPAKND